MKHEPGPEARRDAAVLDASRRYVRITGERDGFIEFNFSVGEPDLFVELILSPEAFKEFCESNRAEILPREEHGHEERSDWEWRLSDARETRLK